ncbi:hypothetical protein BGZ92_006143, partial [Podila epicladia]
MTKRNKKKILSNITAQSVFVSEGQSSNNTREATGTLSTSTSAATLTASIPNSPQPPSQLRKRGLENLDHTDDEDTPLNNTNGKTAMKSTTKKQHQATKEASMSASSWTPTARETSDSTTSFWAWLTASRAISELQREYESKEERARKAVHDQKLAALLGMTSLGEQKPLLAKNKIKNKFKDTKDDEKDLEKKNVKYSWDHAKMQQAFDMTGRDWAALSALTVATLG